jgi:hypothetical protein
MREKVLGSIVLVVAALAATWAIAVDSRNVVREREIEKRLSDRGAKSKVPDPAAVVDCETCAYGYLWSKDSACLDSAGNIDYASPCDNGMYGAEAIGSVRIILGDIAPGKEKDIAVPKPEPVATCDTDACVDHCRSNLDECKAFMLKTCTDKHPLRPGSAAISLRQVTSFKVGVECAFICPTKNGGIEEFECLTQREIDARKKRSNPQTLPPGELDPAL